MFLHFPSWAKEKHIPRCSRIEKCKRNELAEDIIMEDKVICIGEEMGIDYCFCQRMGKE